MRKTAIILLIAAIALGVDCYLLWNSSFGRRLRGICTVTVVNDSGKTLSDMVLTVFEANEGLIISAGLSVKTVDYLEPAERREFLVGSDIVTVGKLEFSADGQNHAWDGGGHAEPGETYVITINSDYSVSSSICR